MDNKNSEVPVRGVIPLNQMVGEDEEDTRLLRVMAQGALNYIRCFPWCKKIIGEYFGDGYGGILAVFLFRIEPSRPDIDEWLWIIFGDVPPAYLVTDICKTPSQALEGYIGEIGKWIQLAKTGRSSSDVIPVYVPATPENAAELESRLKFLREILVPAFREAETIRS